MLDTGTRTLASQTTFRPKRAALGGHDLRSESAGAGAHMPNKHSRV